MSSLGSLVIVRKFKDLVNPSSLQIILCGSLLFQIDLPLFLNE
jgi:hypothetical protein